jgi:Integrase core domain
VRDELLAVELFQTLTKAQVMVADWREDYNHHRPHSSLGMAAPARFAQAWRQTTPNGKRSPSATPHKPADRLRTRRRRPGTTKPRPIAWPRPITPPSASRCARPPGSLRETPSHQAPLRCYRHPTPDSHNRWTDEQGPRLSRSS